MTDDDRLSCQRYRMAIGAGYPRTCELCGLVEPCRLLIAGTTIRVRNPSGEVLARVCADLRMAHLAARDRGEEAEAEVLMELLYAAERAKLKVPYYVERDGA